MSRAPFARLAALAARFGARTEGVAAIEFALVLPVMLTIYFGVVAVTVGVNTDRKVTLVARTVADLTGRATVMSCTDVVNTVGAATAVLAPYDPTGMSIAIAAVFVTDIGTASSPNLQAKVQWSQARKITGSSGQQGQGTLPAGWSAGSIISPIPSGYATANASFILTKVDKTYKPVVGGDITGNIALTETTPWPVRNAQQVTWTGSTSCP